MRDERLTAVRARLQWAGESNDLSLVLEDAAAYATQMLSDAQNSSDPALLSAVIDLWQRIIQAVPQGYPGRATYLANFGGALRTRFERYGDEADLDAAIALVREALRCTPEDHPDRVWLMSNLGNARREQFERGGVEAALDSAVTLGREAVEKAAEGDSNRATYLSNLGNALRLRFQRDGSDADLDDAIDSFQKAVDVALERPPHPLIAMYLSNLGNALRERFERGGARKDVDDAIKLGERAVQATPDSHPDRAGRLFNLGAAWQRQFERTGALEDLENAVKCGKAAVKATHKRHPNRPMYLSGLGVAWQQRFERTGALEDLENAVKCGKAAVKATPEGHLNRHVYLSGLASALRKSSSTRWGREADLDAAIERGQDAVEITLTDHPNYAMYLSNLAIARRERFERKGLEADLDGAIGAWLKASKIASAAPSTRISAAWAAAGLLERSGKEREAAEAAEAAVRLLPQVVPRRLERSDQQHEVSGFAGLAGDAAALVLAALGGTDPEQAERALGLLEAGRAVLLSQALEGRSDLTDLRDRHPGLARRFTELRERLDAPASLMAATEAGPDRLVQDRHRLAAEFTAVLDEIRSLDGFSSFALPPTREELLNQASQGPVVVFNVSDYRSDALLLTTEGITSLKLPRLTPGTVIDKINAFRRAQQAAVSGADSSERQEAQATLVEVLQWLWDTAAGPVLEALGHHGRPAAAEGGDGEEDWPRVWWAPGGLLGLLPVHAAGYHTDPGGDLHRRTVMDRVVSSYTPTVRALRYARERALSLAVEPPEAVRSLIVAMPTTPGLPGHGRLRFVEAETAMLQKRLPGPVRLREPDLADGPADPTAPMPTKAGVLRHLPECAIAHFACHGVSDPTDPSKSRLLLHDHADAPLTVASLVPVALDRARLAYLSACRTAAIDTPELLDEAIHLTSAFQLAGFPHVIGTLWEINDQIAVAIADLFYAALQTDSAGLDPNRAAHALHKAIRQIRDGHDLPAGFDRTRVPWLWAAYLHAGA